MSPKLGYHVEVMGRHHKSVTDNVTDEVGGRRMCRQCHRPAVTCVCQYLPDQPPVDNRTGITILQHPRERFHPKGTVPIAVRGLRRVHLVVAHFDENTEPTATLDLPAGTGLLYPHDRSRLLAQVAPTERPAHLLLLDGTWGNVHRLYRSNPWLGALPHFHLEPDSPERYRIRGEPDPIGRSTIEAIVEALGILEPETRGPNQLLDAFDKMIDAQIAVIEREAAGARRRVRWGEPHPVHAPLIDHFDEVVLVYTESVACADGRRRPVHWVALRPATGQTFERLLRNRGRNDGAAPNPNHLAHMELTPEDLAGGVTDHQLRHDWHAFAGPHPRIAAWSQSTLDLVATLSDGDTDGNTDGCTDGNGDIGTGTGTGTGTDTGTGTGTSTGTGTGTGTGIGIGTVVQPVLLKAAYCNLRRITSGTLEAVLEREGLRPVATPFRGRAARRIGQALAVLALLTEPSGLHVPTLAPGP